MDKAEAIVQYLSDHGLDITPYIDDFRHVEPDTVCIISISMWRIGSSGRYEHWVKLRNILADPDCPIKMIPVESAIHERPRAFDRLVWKEK